MKTSVRRPPARSWHAILRAARVAAAGIAAVMVAGLVGQSATAAPGQCLPPVVNCPAPAPPSPKVTGAKARYTTAIVRGRIVPGGGRTTYYWSFEIPGGRTRRTRKQSLPAGSSSHAVQARLKRLVPGQPYDVSLVASNRYGGTSDTRNRAFRTRQHPKLSALHVPDHIRLGNEYVKATVRVGGEFDPYAPVHLLVSPAPYQHWQTANDEVRPSRHRRTWIPICPETPCAWMQRNFLVQAKDGRAHTAPRVIWVNPITDLTLYRENDGTSPWVGGTYNAEVHHLRHGEFHPQRIFFYRRSGSRGPWSLIGSKRLHVYSNPPHENADLTARIRFYSRRGVHVATCLRRPLLKDMGEPFFSSSCGRRHLP